MRTWLSQLLVGILAVSALFVAVTSSCHAPRFLLADGGSCSNTQLEAPSIPHATIGEVALSEVRFDVAILIAAVILLLPAAKPARAIQLPERQRQRFVPIEFAMRD